MSAESRAETIVAPIKTDAITDAQRRDLRNKIKLIIIVFRIYNPKKRLLFFRSFYISNYNIQLTS